MNWDAEKRILELKEVVKEKIEPEVISLDESIDKNKGLRINQRYKTIFNCSYTEIEE